MKENDDLGFTRELGVVPIESLSPEGRIKAEAFQRNIQDPNWVYKNALEIFKEYPFSVSCSFADFNIRQLEKLVGPNDRRVLLLKLRFKVNKAVEAILSLRSFLPHR